MTRYLPEPEARALLEALDGFRIGTTDLASLPTVRDLRTWTEKGHRLAAFVLGNTGGTSGGTGGPSGREHALCLCECLPPRPHIVIEPDGWVARLRGLFTGERVLDRSDGIRVASRQAEQARRTWPVDHLLALGQRHPGVRIEALGDRVVAWGGADASARELAAVVLAVVG